MGQKRADGTIVNLSRLLVFSLSVILSLGWLVAPEAVNWARNAVAAYVHLDPKTGVSRLPDFVPSATLPSALVAPASLQKVAARGSRISAPGADGTVSQ